MEETTLNSLHPRRSLRPNLKGVFTITLCCVSILVGKRMFLKCPHSTYETILACIYLPESLSASHLSFFLA